MPKKKGKPQPYERQLTDEKNNREGLTLFRLQEGEEVTLTSNSQFVIIPGDRGHGFVLKVFPDPVVEQPTPVAS